MRLAWIEVRDFRNHRETSLEVPEGLTAMVGPNGHGKTNLLEAMHYLFALESPRVRTDLPLVRVGARSAFLRGEIHAGSGTFLVEIEVRPSGANRVQVNRTVVRRRRDLRASIRSVFSGPDDLAVVIGEPDERRRFMDGAVKALWPPRESALAAYERTLRQRNRLLKDWEGRGSVPPGLEAWDAELIAGGAAVTSLRAESVQRLGPLAGREFGRLAGAREEALTVAYRPSVPGDPLESETLVDRFRDLLGERRADELTRRSTLVGPHRDDLGLTVQGLVARGFASHGEAWGAALSLRLGLAGALAAEAGDPPVAFLDDPFSPFDPERRGRFAASLGGRGQLVLALPDEAQVPPAATMWRVKEGAVVSE
ncbi:MAG TPA: DNA replication and repair protein RecF [Actinomycetota bacterium]|nr:DNA replication and repair protein RecF [Actinomycetota bacterium]